MNGGAIIVELDLNQYSEVYQFLDKEKIDTVHARMVLEQKENGIVFTNKEKNPSTFLIIHSKSGFGVILGQNNSIDFNEDIRKTLLCIEKKTAIRLFVSHGVWQKTIEELLGERLFYYESIVKECSNKIEDKINILSKNNVIGRERIKFEFNHHIFSTINGEIPKGFSIKRIDSKIIKGLTGNVVPRFSWSSDENFLKYGIGFCLIKDEEIVSTAFSAFVSENMIDIGIETNTEYRGRGLGVFPAIEMIKYCVDKGYQPIWGCRKDNSASSKLAKKLGFEEVLKHPWYFSVTG